MSEVRKGLPWKRPLNMFMRTSEVLVISYPRDIVSFTAKQ